MGPYAVRYCRTLIIIMDDACLPTYCISDTSIEQKFKFPGNLPANHLPPSSSHNVDAHLLSQWKLLFQPEIVTTLVIMIRGSE